MQHRLKLGISALKAEASVHGEPALTTTPRDAPVWSNLREGLNCFWILTIYGRLWSLSIPYVFVYL